MKPSKYLKNQPLLKICAALIALVFVVPVVIASAYHGKAATAVATATAGVGLAGGKFEEEVLGTVRGMKTSMDDLTKNYDNLDKETKKSFEELRKAQKDDTASIEDRVRAIQKVQGSLRRELIDANGCPIRRIVGDPEKRAGFAKMLIHQLSLGNEAKRKDLDSGNSPGSGYVPAAELERDIYDVLLSYGAFRNLDVRLIGRSASDILIKTARAAMTFVDEAAAISADSTKAGSKVTATPKKLAGLISASTELLEDSDSGVEADILRDFAESTAEKIDWISFTADGTADATDGSQTGIFYGGTTAAAASTHVSMATLTSNDFVTCLTTVAPEVLMRAAKWFIHPTILAKVLNIKDSNGRPIFLNAMEAPAFGGLGSICGYGVIPVGNAPSTDSTSSKVAAFGDPMGQAIRIRRDFRFDRSSEWAFDTDEITFRATTRVASKTKKSTAFAILTTAAS